MTGAVAKSPRDESVILLLQGLGAVFGDDVLCSRFLSLTGLSEDILRSAPDSQEVLAAVAAFLASHEPTLVKCAASIGCGPERLAAAAADYAEPCARDV